MNFHDQRAAAERIACTDKPYGCGAPAGDPCVNLQTGERLHSRPAHERRLQAAEALSPFPWPHPYLSDRGDAA